jgi:transposase
MENLEKKFIRTGGSLSWDERKEMIEEYLTNKCTKEEIWKKYTGQEQEHGQMLSWMRILGYLSTPTDVRRSSRVQFQTIHKDSIVRKTEYNEESREELIRRLEELEKLLELQTIKTEGYELMIEIAEKELQIPIRKKSDTK